MGPEFENGDGRLLSYFFRFTKQSIAAGNDRLKSRQTGSRSLQTRGGRWHTALENRPSCNMRATVTSSRAATRSVRSVCTVAARASHHPISQHPLRKDVAGVLHGRPFPRLDALPCAVTAITTPPPSPEEERVEVLALRQAHLRERKVVVARAVHRGAVRGVVRDRDALADHAPAWRAQHRQLPTRRSARRLDRAGQLFGPAGDLSTVKPVH